MGVHIPESSMAPDMIDAKQAILSSGLSPGVQEYLVKHSVAANRLSTPFDERELVGVLKRYGKRVIEIVYAYEAPGFSRQGNYVTPEGLDLDGGWDSLSDPKIPGVYGIMEHPDNTISLVMFVREQVIKTTAGGSTSIDRDSVYLEAIFRQYQRLVTLLMEHDPNPNPNKEVTLAMVGILPGVAIKRRNSERLKAFPPNIIDMQERKNKNSAKFVKAGVRRLLEEHKLDEKHLIILGSGGTLGKAVADDFRGAICIDAHNQGDMPKSGKYLVVDCTAGGSLGHYLDKLNPHLGWIWVNESYPPPPKALAQKAREKGILVCHIQGVKGNTIPPFPPGYGSTPPCCAGPLDQDEGDVVVILWE